MQTTLGCWRDAAACASCRNRLRKSSCRAIESFITLMATVRSSTESLALYTTPIAPSPTSSTMWYLPMSGIWVSAMHTRDYTVQPGRCPEYPAGRAILQRRFSERGVDCRWDLAHGVYHRLAGLQQHGLQIQVPLDPAHHIVANHPAIPQIEDGLLLRREHRRADPPVLLGAAGVDCRRPLCRR